MSNCRQDYDSRCERDYSFRVDNGCNLRSRCCNSNSVFPTVLRANVVIPQTVIPISIVFSPVTGAVSGITSIGTNLIAGNGIIPGF